MLTTTHVHVPSDWREAFRVQSRVEAQPVVGYAVVQTVDTRGALLTDRPLVVATTAGKCSYGEAVALAQRLCAERHGDAWFRTVELRGESGEFTL